MQQFFKTARRRIAVPPCNPTIWHTETINEQGLAESVINGAGGASWTNLANIGNNVLDCNANGIAKDGFTDFLVVSQVGFNWPACSTVQDIIVTVRAGTDEVDVTWDWLHFMSSANSNVSNGSSFSGSTGDIRAITVTPAEMGLPDLDAAQINDPGFKVFLAFNNNYNGTNNMWIRYVQLEVRGYIG